MKYWIFFTIGSMVILLSTLYMTEQTEFQITNFNQVFAQSENKIKNFDDSL